MSALKPVHYVVIGALILAAAGWFFRYQNNYSTGWHTDRWTGETCAMTVQC